MRDFRKAFGATATELGGLLAKWGFLDAEVTSGGATSYNAKQLARYLSAAARSVLVSVLEERRKIEEERRGGN